MLREARKIASPDQALFLDIAISSSKLLEFKVADILDYSQLFQNSFKIQTKQVKVEKLVKGLENIFSLQIRNRPVQLIPKIEKNVPYEIPTDEERLLQVLSNLLSNALKFTPTQQ